MSYAEKVKLASIVPIGGSEDETARQVRQLFRKNKENKQLTQDDCNYLDMLQDEQEALEVF